MEFLIQIWSSFFNNLILILSCILCVILSFSPYFKVTWMMTDTISSVMWFLLLVLIIFLSRSLVMLCWYCSTYVFNSTFFGVLRFRIIFFLFRLVFVLIYVRSTWWSVIGPNLFLKPGCLFRFLWNHLESFKFLSGMVFYKERRTFLVLCPTMPTAISLMSNLFSI